MKKLLIALALVAAPTLAHATNPVIANPVHWAEKMVCYALGESIAFEATRNLPAWNLNDGDGTWNLASGYWVTRQGDVQDIASWGENPPKYTAYVRTVTNNLWREVCAAVLSGNPLPKAPARQGVLK